VAQLFPATEKLQKEWCTTERVDERFLLEPLNHSASVEPGPNAVVAISTNFWTDGYSKMRIMSHCSGPMTAACLMATVALTGAIHN
jgi:hypothetical protein